MDINYYSQMERLLIDLLMLMNLCTASGWVHLSYYNMKLGRGKFRFYCLCLAAYFLVVSFISWDAYALHHRPLVWDLFTLRFISGIIALVPTFGFVINADHYDPINSKDGIPISD